MKRIMLLKSNILNKSLSGLLEKWCLDSNISIDETIEEAAGSSAVFNSVLSKYSISMLPALVGLYENDQGECKELCSATTKQAVATFMNDFEQAIADEEAPEPEQP